MVAKSQNQAFHYALLASLALHALVLFTFTDWWEPARRALQIPPALIARLMEPEPALPQAQPAPPVEKPAPQKQKAAKPAPQRVPEPEAVVAPAPAEATPAPPPRAAPPQPALVPAPASPPVASARRASPPAAPGVEALAAQTADQYRMELIAAARRIKDQLRYPPQAWENHWEGDVVLAVSIGANGRHSIVVNRSSRYEVLDQQAVQILGQALREVPLPPALRGRESVLKDVTVQYRQKD